MRSLVKPHTSPSPSSPPLKGGGILQPSPLEGEPACPVGRGEGEGALLMNSFVTAVKNQAGVCRSPNHPWPYLLPAGSSAVFAFHAFELLFQGLFNRQRHKPFYAAAQGGDFLNNRCSQVRVFFTGHHECCFYL